MPPGLKILSKDFSPKVSANANFFFSPTPLPAWVIYVLKLLLVKDL